MKTPNYAFNIDLLQLNPNSASGLQSINELSIFDSNKESFHPKGLFSDTIFGPVGSDQRNNIFGYIDIKLPVLHPVIYRSLVQSRAFYQEIMSGKTYAEFSEAEKDFVKSDVLNGDTGYEFFISRFKDIELKDTDTNRRRQVIQLLSKYKDLAFNDKIIVLPAGLRDVEFDQGRPTYDDINLIYKKIISLANTINASIVRMSPKLVDKTRFRIQEAFLELYMNIVSRIEGKQGLFLGKWATRRIFNTTRNVLTASVPSGRYLHDPNNHGYNDNLVGIYQQIKANLPIARFHIKNSFLVDVFPDEHIPANLINKETLQSEQVRVTPKIYEYFQSMEGIDKFTSDFKHEWIKHRPIEVLDHYLALIYLNPNNKTFRIFFDIRDLPAELDRKLVRPLTYIEFFYYVLKDSLERKTSMITRYPVAGVGSSPIVYGFMKTTVEADSLFELDPDWNKSDKTYGQWPRVGEATHESISPPVATLGGLSADFDGDTGSYNCSYSDEALEEQREYLSSRRAYINAKGQFTRSISVDTTKYIFHNLTKPPVKAE